MRIDKRFGAWLYAGATRLNTKNVNRAIRFAESAERIVDLGCGDGRNALDAVRGIACVELWGVESHAPACEQARQRGIRVVSSDLNGRLPFDDGFFDIVMSNQVLEHLHDTDSFLFECRRVLKTRGLLIVSTENMASWHNIVALLAGWQPFSSINYSTKIYPLGNPLSLHAGRDGAVITHEGMTHRRIFAYRGLKELIAAHGFEIAAILGSGYYPFPASLGQIDKRHAHFLTVAARCR